MIQVQSDDSNDPNPVNENQLTGENLVPGSGRVVDWKRSRTCETHVKTGFFDETLLLGIISQ